MTTTNELESSIGQFIQRERLPDNYTQSIHRYYLPLAEHIAAQHRQSEKTIVVGINGAQGTGKSTLSLLLQHLLIRQDLRVVIISIDDLYLTKSERDELATTIHPLLRTRGVPGTHDLALGLEAISSLVKASQTTTTAIPRFNKAIDDRHDPTQWTHHQGATDIIILEGWCVGAKPCQLTGAPINILEAQSDGDGKWRQFVQFKLNSEYQRLFDTIDMLVMLKAPSMECIIQWRTLQEHKLAQKVSTATVSGEHSSIKSTTRAPIGGIMSDRELLWFVMHYERLTRIMLETLPEKADIVFTLDDQHNVINSTYAPKGSLSR